MLTVALVVLASIQDSIGTSCNYGRGFVKSFRQVCNRFFHNVRIIARAKPCYKGKLVQYGYGCMGQYEKYVSDPIIRIYGLNPITLNVGLTISLSIFYV